MVIQSAGVSARYVLVDKMNAEFFRDFRRGYATVIHKICKEWKHDQDSSNNYCQTRVRQVMPFETLSVIYQPGPVNEDGFVDVGHVLISIKKSVLVGKTEKDEMRQIICELHKMLLEDHFCLKNITKNRWFCELPKNPKAEDVLQIISPLKMIKTNVWKLSFKLNDDIDGAGSLGWIPKSISSSVDLFEQLSFDDVVCNMKQ